MIVAVMTLKDSSGDAVEGFPNELVRMEFTRSDSVDCIDSTSNFRLCCYDTTLGETDLIKVAQDSSDEDGKMRIVVDKAAGWDAQLKMAIRVCDFSLFEEVLVESVTSFFNSPDIAPGPEDTVMCFVGTKDGALFGLAWAQESFQEDCSYWFVEYDGCDTITGTDGSVWGSHYLHSCSSPKMELAPQLTELEVQLLASYFTEETLLQLIDVMSHPQAVEDYERVLKVVRERREESSVPLDSGPAFAAVSESRPNPFNPVATVAYDVPQDDTPVTLAVFDLRGRMMRRLVNEVKQRGSYTVKWDGRDEHGNELPSAVYFYRAKIGDFSDTKKMILLK
jgi:hypothetical protein